MKLFRIAFCWLAFSALSLPGHAQGEPTAALTPSPTAASPGTSDSGAVENRLLFRVRKALRPSNPTNAPIAENLGAPGGYHWIILMQVARYSDSNVRLTDMRRGVQRFMETLAASRSNELRGAVTDTVSVLPYHFSLLGEARGRVQPLNDYLSDTSKLKAKVPGLPQDDRYQGQTWRDGHDWRAAMLQTLSWMGANDIEPQHTILIVLDWNDLAQAPLTLSDGSKAAAPASDKDLILPTNPALYKAFSDAMQSAGLDPKKALETVQVGNLEYDLAVFTPKDLQPIPIGANSSPTVAATPSPTPIIDGNKGSGNNAVLLLFLLAGMGGAAFFLTRPVSFRLDEQESRQVAALPAKVLPLLGKKTEASGPHFRLQNVNLDTDRPLAVIQTDFSKKLLVTNGALSAQNSEGFDQTPAGLRLRGTRGEFDLVDSATGRVVTSVSIRRL